MFKTKILVFAVVIIALSACKNPTDDIKIIIDTDIIKNTALINVTDAQTGNSAPNGVVITILGAEAANVYELSGKKNIVLTNGMVTIGLHPDLIPTADKPVTVSVEISGADYNKETKQITFTAAQKQQVVNIAITKTGNTAPPIVIPPLPTYNTTNLTFVGRCPNRNDLEVRPSVYVSFKKAGSASPFQHLGFMDKGNLTTNLLALNETYEFQIVFGGVSYKTSQKIERANYNLVIDMPEACNL